MTGLDGIPREVRDSISSQLFRHSPSSILVIDRDFRVVAANERFVGVFGPAQGKHCYEVYKDRDRICEECQTAKTFKDGRVRIHEGSGIDRNGRPAYYVVHIAPIFDRQGGIPYVMEMSYDVTESQALQRRYNVLFERVPCYVAIINRDLRIVRANEMLRHTFGDRVGERCYRVYKGRETPCEDCPAARTFRGEGNCTARQVGVDKNGNPTVYVVSTAPLAREGEDFEHIIEMSVDVTENEKLSAELLKESRFRENLQESALDALVAVDAKERVQIFNPAAEALFKVEADEVIGKGAAERFLPEAFLDLVRRGGDTLLLPETEVRTEAGESLPVRLSGTVLREADRVIGGAAFLQDLTSYKQLERENLENERLAAVGQTVAQLAHGIKNILTGLQGGMYVMNSGIKRSDQARTRKGWEMLERNVSRITELVKGFLGFSKGHLPEVKLVDPGDVAREVYELYQDAAQKRGVILRLELEGAMDPAWMDPEDMHACLENLVSNALDACQTAERGPEQTDRNGELRVTIRATEKDEVILYEVADTGCGMDYEIKNRVFTTFFTTKGLGGTGLGLMVTRKIVQEHGGKISVDSTPGEGSVFRIRLPRRRLPGPKTEQPTLKTE